MGNIPPNILFPAIFGIIGLLLLSVYFKNLARVRASQSWPTVQGTVVESWIKRSDSTDEDGSTSTTYYPEIRYRYQVMGSEYQGDKISFGPKVGGGRSGAEEVVANYPVGSTVTVYYQPDNPEIAVLERNISRLFLFMGTVFALVGMFVYIRWG